VRRLWAVAWLAGSSGFSDESSLEVAPPDRRPDSRPTAFTTMRYINRRSLPFTFTFDLNSTASATILINIAVTAELIVCRMWFLDMHSSSPIGGAGAVSGDGEFVILGLPVFL